METEKKDYSKTVFLPKTSFPMKANLSQREPVTIKNWQDKNLYKQMIEKRSGCEQYLLHDGPPYANGHIHIGHALNKILKDFLVKSMSLMGKKAPYVPGWDCHGLPIEQQLLKELKMGKRHIENIPEFRQKAREFAMKFIDIQREEFKRLGILGEWENPYITMSNEYESKVVEAFLDLLEKGYIQRDKKTIYWCVTCETALADAEVEYADKKSYSIFVKFKVLKKPSVLEKYDDLFLVIWTTTPWTLPANMAAAVSEKEDYSVLKTSAGHLLVAKKLVEGFLKETSLQAQEVFSLSGKELVSMEYEHCLAKRLPENMRFPRKVISTDFVDMSTGSGTVHIAPGHGEEDFYAGKKWGLDIVCPVDEKGLFDDLAGEFKGMRIFDANETIVSKLNEDALLIKSGHISHSYPHCWRCKNPVIFRATKQWFLKIDVNSLREKLLKTADGVKWIPNSGKERISSMLKLRPDWCLSRQRYWGTPIIAFYCEKCSKEQPNMKILRSWQDRISKEGSDFWFAEPIEKLLPSDYKCECGSSKFYKEKDILDVWLDSGVSWHSVVRARFSDSAYPCDMYLEGSDQHRGWFQTSLIPSVALNSKAPYKNVLTHGFVLDEHGKAMHKSAGNVVAPQEIINKYGAEILRLWVALTDYSDDVRISDKLLSGPVDMYRKIRNTFRYMLGNLSGFNLKSDPVSYDNMLQIDKYMLFRTKLLCQKVKKDYENYEYRDATKSINDFCILDMSSFYLDALKDRLYTYPLSSIERKSAQVALNGIFKSLCVITAPVLSFTAEEAWQIYRQEIDSSVSESVFLSDWPSLSADLSSQEIKDWERIMSLRDLAFKSMEDLRKSGEIGSSVEAKIIISANEKDYEFLSLKKDLLAQVFIVSDCEIVKDSNLADIKISASHAEGEKCPRCWQWRKDMGSDKSHMDICGKCAKAIKEIK